MFDGQNVLHFEDSGEEYTLTKQRRNGQEFLPEPYALDNADWSKAAEGGQQSCGLSKLEHECVVVEVPLNPSASTPAGRHILGGTEQLLIDTQLGLVLSARKVQSIETAHGSYQSDVTYTLERMAYGGPKPEALFRLPSLDMKQVKELSGWSAAKVKKQLGGKPAPELAVTDLHGKPLALSEYKGKTVLLDFWATWCGPCRADGPAIEKLYSQYGGKNLAVVGISVSEDRAVVEQFLQGHPHTYPIVLTTENEMPRAYQVREFPTYIIIDPNGNVASAVSGQEGFAELRKLLKKAGLDTDRK